MAGKQLKLSHSTGMNNLAYQNLTVLTPKSLDSMLPLEIIDDSSPIRAAFVERYGIDHLPSSWKEACGFYILFSHINPDNTFEAYVGKATNGFYNRLKSHDKEKSWWRTALMVFKDREPGFSSTQSAYMEGKMREILESSRNVTIHNIAATGDKTLPAWEENSMEAIALSTLRIMFLRGYRNASMARIAEELVIKTEPADEDKERQPALRIPARPQRPVKPETLSSSPARTPPMPERLTEQDAAPVDAEAENRFQRLRTWRMEVARGKGWAPYMVFKDAALRAIAKANPQQPKELYGVPGVSKYKADTYGQDIVDTLSEAEV